MTIPREAIEAGEVVLSHHDLWATSEDVEAALAAALPFLRRAWVLGVLHDQEVERVAAELGVDNGFTPWLVRQVLRAALGVGEDNEEAR